jgi:myosin heavy subunit
MAEATRLLNLMVRNMEAWANEEAKQGIATAHGPKVEEDILGELAAVLDEESGARQAVKDLILTGRDKRITKCSTACEKFVDQAKSFIEGLTPVKERLTEFETAAADEEKQRKISSIGKVPALEEKVAAAKEKFEDKKKELKDKEKEIKANKDEDEEAKLEKEQEKLEKEMEKFEAEWEKLKEQLDELNDKVKEEAGDLADKEKDTQSAQTHAAARQRAMSRPRPRPHRKRRRRAAPRLARPLRPSVASLRRRSCSTRASACGSVCVRRGEEGARGHPRDAGHVREAQGPRGHDDNVGLHGGVRGVLDRLHELLLPAGRAAAARGLGGREALDRVGEQAHRRGD